MALSVFDLFSIGIGPSSSHTVGPMRAAKMFMDELAAHGRLDRVGRIEAKLYGSLGATGRGHASDKAVLMGLAGEEPESCSSFDGDVLLGAVRSQEQLTIMGGRTIRFVEASDLRLIGRESLPWHPNGMVLTAYDEAGAQLEAHTYYSVGGGFVVRDAGSGATQVVADQSTVAHPFHTADELLAICDETGLSIAEVMLANELTWRTADEVRAGLLRIRDVMLACIDAGLAADGILPGGLKVPRRAPDLHRRLLDTAEGEDQLRGLDWLIVYAMAVNEENAAGGRVVTAPTNGAAGIIPAVLAYYSTFVPGADDDGVLRFLLTAGAIGVLYKEMASISGAEVGCQGEVGSASSMAAGAYAAVLGGTHQQVENAAEIAMEHNLGLTCDPIGGLVQIPCIERNGVGAVKAVTAARTALSGDGTHIVSLDQVIRTMRDTGRDMKKKYKETSRGGLAVNVIEC